MGAARKPAKAKGKAKRKKKPLGPNEVKAVGSGSDLACHPLLPTESLLGRHMTGQHAALALVV